MALAPVLLLSILLHALIGWRVAPGLALLNPVLGTGLWVTLTLSALLMPMGMLARRVAKPPLSTVLTWLGLLCMGLFSSLLVLTLLREVLLLAACRAFALEFLFRICYRKHSKMLKSRLF